MMVRLNELRIGSLVEAYGVFKRVEGISLNEIQTNGGEVYECDELNAITINKDFFSTCPVIDGDCFELCRSKRWISIKMAEYDWIVMDSDRGKPLLNVDFVHELQNVFYCFIGNELKLDIC